MNKNDIVKLRIEPQRKKAWKEYAENCLPSMNLSQLVTMAVDYFVSGSYWSDTMGNARKIDGRMLSQAFPKYLSDSNYLEAFLNDAEKELQRKKERNAILLDGGLG